MICTVFQNCAIKPHLYIDADGDRRRQTQFTSVDMKIQLALVLVLVLSLVHVDGAITKKKPTTTKRVTKKTAYSYQY